MDALYTYLLQTVAGSAILLGVYILLLEKRASFQACRMYLLTATLCAAVIPLLKIPVWSAPAVQTVLQQVEVAMPVSATILADETEAIPWPGIIAGVWGLGILILTGSMLRQVVKIQILRHRARRSSAPDYTIARTQEQIGSFSFLRTIYLWEGTPQAQQTHIIAHEASHILHRHTCERLVMEGLKALLWWNPCVWAASRKLLEVHEFQADRDVLGQGYAASDYADTIFGQLFGYNPDITNGLHDSLTKKRLQMMTTQSQGRHSLLRLAATLPAIAGLLCAFSFTTRAAEAATHSEGQSPAKSISRILSDSTQTSIPVTQPLILIDNIQASADAIQALAPETIVSISVIKDESATAKYGSQGANGVILVTTNRERPGIQLFKPDTITLQTSDDTDGQIIMLPSEERHPDEPFFVVEQMPRFQGGNLNTFREWAQGQIHYPKEALDNNIEGRVVVTFVIEKDGSLSPIKILQSPDTLLSNEAIRILKQSPKWEPGTQRGETVRVKYTLPVDFKLPQTQTN